MISGCRTGSMVPSLSRLYNMNKVSVVSTLAALDTRYILCVPSVMATTTVRRPQVKVCSLNALSLIPCLISVQRTHFTWPMRSSSRSHFEDFLREIGESAPEHHLCCVPRHQTSRGHAHEHHIHASSSSSSSIPIDQNTVSKAVS